MDIYNSFRIIGKKSLNIFEIIFKVFEILLWYRWFSIQLWPISLLMWKKEFIQKCPLKKFDDFFKNFEWIVLFSQCAFLDEISRQFFSQLQKWVAFETTLNSYKKITSNFKPIFYLSFFFFFIWLYVLRSNSISRSIIIPTSNTKFNLPRNISFPKIQRSRAPKPRHSSSIPVFLRYFAYINFRPRFPLISYFPLPAAARQQLIHGLQASPCSCAFHNAYTYISSSVILGVHRISWLATFTSAYKYSRNRVFAAPGYLTIAVEFFRRTEKPVVIVGTGLFVLIIYTGNAFVDVFVKRKSILSSRIIEKMIERTTAALLLLLWLWYRRGTIYILFRLVFASFIFWNILCTKEVYVYKYTPGYTINEYMTRRRRASTPIV